MDTELFELCKEVYEKTGWDEELLSHWQERIGGDGQTMFDVISYEPGIAPLYTSDYLLEKLPALVNRNILNMDKFEHRYCFRYGMPSVAHYTKLDGEADTPLKALLRLTLALAPTNQLPPKGEQ